MALTFSETWSPQVLERLENDLLISKITNRNYEGEVKGGNAVNIYSVGLPNVVDYTRDGANASTIPSNSTVKLLINKEKWTSEYIDKVTAGQVPYDMQARAVQGTAQAMANFIENEVLAYMYAQAPKATAVTITAANVYAQILAAKKTLTTNKVPLAGRFLVVTPEVEVLILESNKLVPTTDPAQLSEGVIGRIAGFNVYVSNYLADISKAQLLAGHTIATTVAMQVEDMLEKQVEDGNGVKIQNNTVYGRLVTHAPALIAIPNV